MPKSVLAHDGIIRASAYRPDFGVVSGTIHFMKEEGTLLTFPFCYFDHLPELEHTKQSAVSIAESLQLPLHQIDFVSNYLFADTPDLNIVH